jgi:hypothetical protein
MLVEIFQPVDDFRLLDALALVDPVAPLFIDLIPAIHIAADAGNCDGQGKYDRHWDCCCSSVHWTPSFCGLDLLQHCILIRPNDDLSASASFDGGAEGLGRRHVLSATINAFFITSNASSLFRWDIAQFSLKWLA